MSLSGVRSFSYSPTILQPDARSPWNLAYKERKSVPDDLHISSYANNWVKLSKEQIKYIKGENGKFIAYQPLGDIQLGHYLPKEYDWGKKFPGYDKNLDGRIDQDSGAPKFLGPVNLSWEYHVDRPSYKGKYPSYLVRYWEKEYIDIVKETIDELIAKGIDGIFFDVVMPSQWLEKTEVENEIYTINELAEYTEYFFKEIHKYIKKNKKEFYLIPNGTEQAFRQAVDLNPKILKYFDAILIENQRFFDGDGAKGHVDIVNANISQRFERSIGGQWRALTKLSIFTVDAVESDPKIFEILARDSDDYQIVQNIVFDHVRRRPDGKDGTTEIPHLFTLLDNRNRDKLQGAKNLNNLLVGLGGDDELIGNAGDDYFMGGTGNDTINGGKGFDRAVYKFNKEAYIITEYGQEATVEKKSDYEQHSFIINLFHWNGSGRTNTIDLIINGDKVLAQQVLKSGTNSFAIEINEKINSIEYRHNQESYNDGTAISSAVIDGVDVDLSKAIFLDNKEKWMGIDIHGNLGTGSARVKFEVTELNRSNKDEGVDKLLDVEEIRFLDQSYSLKQVRSDYESTYPSDEDDVIGVPHKISSPKKFNKKSVDKITNFNTSADTLQINTDSFGINSSGTFAAGKNKKAVKKKLAKQDFDFLYDEKKGGLYFNENGADKGFGDGGIIAILKGAPDLTSGNLEFV